MSLLCDRAETCTLGSRYPAAVAAESLFCSIRVRWMRLYHQLMAQGPAAEAMSREGKGTQAASEAGRSQPLSWSDVETGPRWLGLADHRRSERGAARDADVCRLGRHEVLHRQQRAGAQEPRNLEVEPRCVITTDTGDLHLVIEGVARHVHDEATLQRAVAAFHAVYQWPTRVVGNQLDADYGAATSGGPPYEAYEVTPIKALAFRPTVRP
jgi:hypothetical protein